MELENLSNYWNISVENVYKEINSNVNGISDSEAKNRLEKYGLNKLAPPKKSDSFVLLLSQFKSPIILILIFAAILSLFLGDRTDAYIILTIIFISGMLGFWQERGASNAVKKLLEIVQIKSNVIRNGNKKEIHVEEIVPGDVVILSAGSVVPGDALIIESKDLFVDEAALTGETFPVEKNISVLDKDTVLSKRTNSLFMGTHVVSGTGKAIIIFTGVDTEFGKVSERLKLRPSETEFEKGVRKFGYLLMEVTMVMIFIIFAFNVYLHKPIVDSFLFSLALAVGLTPTLLPAIISVNLSHGAKRMAKKKVIVKRLNSIENFGSMNVLCSDKTGTLTEGKVKIYSFDDVNGNQNEKVMLYAQLNAYYQTGFSNPIDQAIVSYGSKNYEEYKKLDEIPYDFLRKRLSVLVEKDNTGIIITKGALDNVLEVCKHVEVNNNAIENITESLNKINDFYYSSSSKGYRVLGVAYKNINDKKVIELSSEEDMIFLGFILLYDPPKPGVGDTLINLNKMGVSLKIITGDNKLVAENISRQIGVANIKSITGSQIRKLSDEALYRSAGDINIFAEVEPNQKERIIIALKKAGNVVGYLGDGINDASALHAADVGISVESAVDVAKEAADLVLLETDLNVLLSGIEEGRITFANTIKYVFMATSANFGNMFSMAGASLFLPFLPLLPKQILLTNLLTDFPEMTIATDSVDEDWIEKPRRWDIKFIRRFMMIFGAISSLFDYATFGVLLWILNANVDQFRTGWFIESVISAVLIVLVVRTKKTFYKSKPGKSLLITSIAIIIFTLIIPISPLIKLFEFIYLQPIFILYLSLIIVGYVFTAEIAKKIFYRYSS
ncbi:MAG: magnesium-translocating P-type ATPase [Ignavibacterium sp.]|nr:magnesium-translocating P-type ATPase [Ignavibacterium sp.]